jgi:cyclopropane fatty-acyl-phospholipid synthase-like methyltransferase
VSGPDDQTLAFYEKDASKYLDARPDAVSPFLDSFLVLLPTGATVLELGCGGGRDAQNMIERGFDVDPTDGAASMAERAAAKLGRPVRILRFDELDARHAYDAVVAINALLHVPRTELTGILTRVWNALKPGGWHFANYKSCGTEARDDHGRYYNHPTRTQIERHYRAAGNWNSLSFDEAMSGGHLNKASPVVTVTSQKAALG